MFEPIRGFTSLQRTPQTDLKLGSVLAFVAGATNAGGFLAVGQYTSHMTGMVSSVADHLVLGELTLALAGAGAVLAFLLGAMTTAWLVNWGLRRELRSAYGLPLMLEASLLLVFGLFGAAISLFKQAGPAASGAGVSSGSMAEKFTFHQLCRNAGAVHGDKRLVGTLTLLMQCLCHQFFAATAFAQN